MHVNIANVNAGSNSPDTVDTKIHLLETNSTADLRFNLLEQAVACPDCLGWDGPCGPHLRVAWSINRLPYNINVLSASNLSENCR